jgi:hypothetical protein
MNITAGKQSWLGHLGQFLSVLTVIIIAALWLQESLHGIDMRLRTLESHVKDRWSRTDMQIWAQDFQLQNDEVSVPRVRSSVLYQREDGQ